LFLFIGESIGMQELIFIGVIALIIFGPRKLPQMARTIGKAMAEFRRTTSEFKETWQKEVDFEEFKVDEPMKRIAPHETPVAREAANGQSQPAAPEIKELNAADYEHLIPLGTPETRPEPVVEHVQAEKKNWL
jgi:Tat protein translocase TatB subunit